MIENALHEWSETNNERSKLQHAYIIGAVVLIVAAGLIGLIDYDLGQKLTSVALVALGVFFINLISWTLLSGLVLTPLSVRRAISREFSKKSASRTKSASTKPAKKK